MRDLGSLNGTYLNGERIGQRSVGLSGGQRQENIGQEFLLKSGDRLGLGNDCELELRVEEFQYLSNSPPEMPVTEMAPTRSVDELKRECQDSRRCEICGKTVDSEEAYICAECYANPARVLAHLRAHSGDIAGFRGIEMLGEGGMGHVWLVEEKGSGRRMALKLIRPKLVEEEQVRADFLREAYVAGQLEHENIVRHYESGQYGERCFILMEYCEGGSLANLLRERGGILELETATSIILQVLDGLEYAHKAPLFVKLENGETVKVNGIVHRDIKPGNIFLSDRSEIRTVKVGDFGLAKAFKTSGMSGHTIGRGAKGAPEFMPRQQVLEFRYAMPEVDIWATAATYYYILTGCFTKD